MVMEARDESKIEPQEPGRQAIDWNEGLLEQASAVCAIARRCSERGWLPAAAGNFSFRDSSAADAPNAAHSSRIFITPNGIEKGDLNPAELLELDADCRVIAGPTAAIPSTETSLHGVIYRERPQTNAIFHVHSIADTLLSDRNFHHNPAHPGRSVVSLAGYELLKALSGVSTHDHRELVPILENSQDYDKLSRELKEVLRVHPAAHGVLLHRHGLYAWGESVWAAWKHLEALEFLLEVESHRIVSES